MEPRMHTDKTCAGCRRCSGKGCTVGCASPTWAFVVRVQRCERYSSTLGDFAGAIGQGVSRARVFDQPLLAFVGILFARSTWHRAPLLYGLRAAPRVRSQPRRVAQVSSPL